VRLSKMTRRSACIDAWVVFLGLATKKKKPLKTQPFQRLFLKTPACRWARGGQLGGEQLE
jgi:hypothetical protein